MNYLPSKPITRQDLKYTKKSISYNKKKSRKLSQKMVRQQLVNNNKY